MNLFEKYIVEETEDAQENPEVKIKKAISKHFKGDKKAIAKFAYGIFNDLQHTKALKALSTVIDQDDEEAEEADGGEE